MIARANWPLRNSRNLSIQIHLIAQKYPPQDSECSEPAGRRHQGRAVGPNPARRPATPRTAIGPRPRRIPRPVRARGRASQPCNRSIRPRACSAHIERASRRCKGLRSCRPTGSSSIFEMSAKGRRVFSSSTPLLVSLPSAIHSGSAIRFSGNSSPRGILIPKLRSRRKTMSRKSMDSAPRSPWSVASRVTSSSSTPKASTRVAWTFSKISSYVGIGSSESRWECPPTPRIRIVPETPANDQAARHNRRRDRAPNFRWMDAGGSPWREAARRDVYRRDLGGRNSTHIMSKKRNRCNIIRRRKAGAIRDGGRSTSRSEGMRAGAARFTSGERVRGDRFATCAGQTGVGNLGGLRPPRDRSRADRALSQGRIQVAKARDDRRVGRVQFGIRGRASCSGSR